MNRHVIPTLIYAIVSFVPLFTFAHAFAELIEPTRTLDSVNDSGRISVFSEPPGLPIGLDGQVVGTTPLTSYEIEKGQHVLRIADTETHIYQVAGKHTKLSYFKGTIIKIPEEKQAQTVEKAGDEGRRAASTPAQEKKREDYTRYDDPFYWPVRPFGPIH